VEQKNGVVVRQLVGYDRFEGEMAYLQLREIYRAVRLYVNFFQPSMKLQEKHRNGARVQRSYDPAKTPFQRLRAALGIEATANLDAIYQALDPVELLRQIRVLQDALWKHAVLRIGDHPPEKDGTVQLPEIRFEPTAQNGMKKVSDTFPITLEQQKRKYRRTKALRAPHTWRTRENPFQPVWDEICEGLENNPERTAKSLFLELQKRYPGQYPDGQLRTLQRRVQEWRAKAILTFDDRWIEENRLLKEGLPLPLGITGRNKDNYRQQVTTETVAQRGTLHEKDG